MPLGPVKSPAPKVLMNEGRLTAKTVAIVCGMGAIHGAIYGELLLALKGVHSAFDYALGIPAVPEFPRFAGFFFSHAPQFAAIGALVGLGSTVVGAAIALVLARKHAANDAGKTTPS